MLTQRALLLKVCLVCLALIGMKVQAVDAQNYPARLIRIVSPSSVGSGADLVGRLIAPAMSEYLHQKVIVENHPGAGNNIGAELVAKAPPDGYTILMVQQSHTVNVTLYRRLRYDFVRDFSPVLQLASVPLLVTVHPSLPAHSVGDLVKLAKARPGTIHYSSAGAGTSTFLAAELFKKMAGINLVAVPYNGGSPALTAVMSGETSVYFAPLSTAVGLIRQGSLRLLAVGTAKRLPMFPEHPTVSESGYPGYECGSWHGLVVPARTPKEIVAVIHRASLAALNRPDVAKRLGELGYVIVGDQPEEFAGFIKSEIEKWRKIILEAGLTAD